MPAQLSRRTALLASLGILAVAVISGAFILTSTATNAPPAPSGATPASTRPPTTAPSRATTSVPQSSPTTATTATAAATSQATLADLAPTAAATPVPTVTPVADAEATGGEFAPWVYAWPSVHPVEWPRAWRWQDPLPVPWPSRNWAHSTYRLPQLATPDQPFILVRAERVAQLTGVQLQAMVDLVQRHHEMRHALFAAAAPRVWETRTEQEARVAFRNSQARAAAARQARRAAGS